MFFRIFLQRFVHEPREFLSMESASMADALQEAKHALEDAKLRIRVAEAAMRRSCLKETHETSWLSMAKHG